MIYCEDYGDKPQCKTCSNWIIKSDEDNKGYCNAIPGDGIEIEINTGDSGGYISSIITDGDFFCALYE